MRNTISAVMTIGACLLTPGANAQKIDWRVFTEPFVSSAHAQDVDWQKIDETLGRKPAVTGDVHRYGFPRRRSAYEQQEHRHFFDRIDYVRPGFTPTPCGSPHQIAA